MWAIEWQSKNDLDGERRFLLGGPPYSHGGKGITMLFGTREMARNHINEKYGYLRARPDLKQEPHGWFMPQAVKVQVMKRDSEVCDAL